MMKDLVSVVIPMFNSQDFILNTLLSIQKQSYKNIEIIVVDDGSTDGSFEQVNELASKDKRIKLLRQKNSGAGIARNHGMDIAKGEYIRFVDSDDILPEDSIEYMLKMAKEYKVDVVLGPMHFYWSEEKTRLPHPHKKIYGKDHRIVDPKGHIELGENASVCNKLYKTSFLKKNDIRFPDRHIIAEDIIFTFKVYFSLSKMLILSSEKVTYYWRVREGSVSRSGYSEKYISDRLLVTDIIEDFIIENGLWDTPLGQRILRRNINSILDIIKTSPESFLLNHFEHYKKQLIYFKSLGFNLKFNPNNIMRQIINIIINNSYPNAIEKIILLSYVFIKDLSIDISKHKIIEYYILEGTSILDKTEEKNYVSKWTNDDAIYFTIPNLEEGIYSIVFEYAWDSKKNHSKYRIGTISGANDTKEKVFFERTKGWSSFSKNNIYIKIDDSKNNHFVVVPENEPGVGFINLKNIYYKKIH